MIWITQDARAFFLWVVVILTHVPIIVRGHEQEYVHFAARRAVEGWTKVGPAADNDTVGFTLYLQSGDEDGLDKKMMEIVDSNGKIPWLRFEELKAFVSPNETVKDSITQTLTSGGAKNITFGRLGNTVTANAEISKASRMFQTSFAYFVRDGVEKPVVRSENYTIPEELRPWVIGLTPLLNFQSKSKASGKSTNTNIRRNPNELGASDRWTTLRNLFDDAEGVISSRGDGTSNDSAALPLCRKAATPNCLRQLYRVDDFNGKPDDPSLALVLFGPEGTNKTDLDAFMSRYRPGVQYDLKLGFGEGVTNEPPPPGEFAELTLDIQTAAGIAAPIPLQGYVLPVGDDTDIAFTSFFDYFTDMPDSERPGVTSYSFGTEESTEATSSLRIGCQSAKHLTALGTTIFVAAGDWGVFGAVKGGTPGETCPPFLPTWPSGCPYVVSVGATVGFTPETAVDAEKHDFWGGGGFSNVFPTPDYQKDAISAYIKSLNGSESGNFNATGRAYPDMSAVGYMIPTIHAGRLGAQLGTSASSPSAAAIFALLNSARREAGLGTVGWVNPKLYQHPEVFVDVTEGKVAGCTDSAGTEHSLPAGPGWDAATGWGSLRFDKLREAFGVPLQEHGANSSTGGHTLGKGCPVCPKVCGMLV